MKPNTLRYVAYIRKSIKSTSRQYLSLKAQKSDLDEFVRERKLIVVATFSESRTARKTGRPAFRAMIDMLNNGSADAILAWHPNRLSRNIQDTSELLQLLEEAVIKDFKFRQFWFENTPQGRLSLTEAFARAKCDIEEMSEGLKKTYREKIRQGIAPHLHAPGYVFDKKTRTHKIDETRAPFVSKLFELVAHHGVSVPAARDVVTTAGFKSPGGQPYPLSVIYYMLHNPAYYGVFMSQNVMHPGIHTPIISKATFDEAQKLLQRSKKQAKRFHFFLYRSQFQCGECNSAITFEIKKKRLRYLRCTKKRGHCSQPYVREESVEKMVEEIVRSVTLRRPWVDFLKQESIREEAKLAQEYTKERDALVSQISVADEKMSSLTDLVAEKVVSSDQYANKMNEWTQKLVAIREKLDFVEALTTNPLEPDQWTLLWLNKALDLQRVPNIAENLQFLRFVGSNFKVRNGQLVVTLKRAWTEAAELNRLVATRSLKPFSKRVKASLCTFLKAARTDWSPPKLD